MDFKNNMIECGKLHYQLQEYLKSLIAPGVSAVMLDEAAAKWAEEHDCFLENLGYKGYPAHICVNINEEVQHSIPGFRQIQEGDLVNIDFSIRYKGVVTDAARTYIVGNVDRRYEKLVHYTKKAFNEALKNMKPGKTNKDLTKNIYKVAKEHNYYPAPYLTGHGIGENMHEEPFIANDINADVPVVKLEVGKAYAIEPIFLIKRDKVVLLHDNWTLVATDGTYSAQYEDTVLLTEDGYINLTNGSTMKGDV